MCKEGSRNLESVIMICVLLLLVMIVWWSRNYFTQLIGNMKDARAQFVQAESESSRVCPCVTNNAIAHAGAGLLSPCRGTNETSECSAMFQRSNVCITGKKIGNTLDDKEHNDAVAICNAYEALDREFTSWLTVLGLVGGVFGLLVPLVGYLLQHHTLNTERKQLREDYKELMNAYVSSISDKVDALEEKLEKIDTKSGQVNERFEKCERQNIRSQEFPLAMRINQMIVAQRSGKVGDTVDIANIIIGFDYLLESLVNWGEDVVIIRAKIRDWINNIDAIWHQMTTEQHEKVWGELRICFKPSREFASREDFLKILRADSEEFKWLEKFFKPFAPWKFS